MKCVVSRLQVAHHPSPEVWLKATQENFIRAYLKFSGPAINCHTCSYMNSEAKCLRGEGSCTIQNSQQCMLKKIFEGIVGTSWGDLCQQTHQPTWVFMGSSWVVGRRNQAVLPRNLEIQQNLILSRSKSRIPATDGEIESLPSRS